MSGSDHGQTVLAAIIPHRRDLLDKALRHLTAQHFVDRVHANLFVMLERYADVTDDILTRTALVDLLTRAKADAGTIAQYTETYDLLAGIEADEAAFKWSCDQLRDLAADRATAEALTKGMEIATRGTTDDRGELKKGHVDARNEVLQRFAEIDRDLSMQDAPEGDMRREGDEILADYAARANARVNGRQLGVNFGIPSLDRVVNGCQNGELILLVAYTSEGKTSLCVQLAWDAVVNQGKNVVILTTETPRGQVRRRLVARHSCLPAFDIPGGINSRDIRMGTLSPAQLRQMADVVQDFGNNPGYGHCYISQVPRGASIAYCESKLTRIQREFDVDLVVMDYLALLRPERRRNSDREELSYTLKGAKQLAVTAKDGAGVPFVSPWQVSRKARQDAEIKGYFSIDALSESAEASNSPDQIISLLAPLDNDQRVVDINAQVMKNRDGERTNTIKLRVDYATSKFEEIGESGSGPRDGTALFGGDPFTGL